MRISPNDPLLRGITINSMTAYLEFLGWVQIEHPNPKLLLFQGPNDDFGEPLDLFIPESTKYSDSYRRLADVVNVISVIEDRDVHEIITNIKYFNHHTNGSFIVAQKNGSHVQEPTFIEL